jgi:hypothetical protein
VSIADRTSDRFLNAARDRIDQYEEYTSYGTTQHAFIE